MSEVAYTETASIGDLEDSDLQLVTDRYEISRIGDHIGEDLDNYGIALVDTDSAAYIEVWVAHGNVPKTHKTAYRVV